MERTTCSTCGKAADRPYRGTHRQTGEILYGCVDSFHTGHLVTPSASSDWHNRKQAKTIRQRARTAQRVV